MKCINYEKFNIQIKDLHYSILHIYTLDYQSFNEYVREINHFFKI